MYGILSTGIHGICILSTPALSNSTNGSVVLVVVCMYVLLAVVVVLVLVVSSVTPYY